MMSNARFALNLGTVNYISVGREETAGRLVRPLAERTSTLAVNYFAHPIPGFVPAGTACGGPKTFPTFLCSSHSEVRE